MVSRDDPLDNAASLVNLVYDGNVNITAVLISPSEGEGSTGQIKLKIQPAEGETLYPSEFLLVTASLNAA